MEKKIKAFDTEKKETIKTLCDQFDKTYEELGNNKVLIKGDNLEGLLDKITMNLLGEIIN